MNAGSSISGQGAAPLGIHVKEPEYLSVHGDTGFVDPELPQPYPTITGIIDGNQCEKMHNQLNRRRFGFNESLRFAIRLQTPEHCFPRVSD